MEEGVRRTGEGCLWETRHFAHLASSMAKVVMHCTMTLKCEEARFPCKGFTLAEVLITLGIIGIVAAMTLPTLITKYQKNQTVNQLKKRIRKLIRQ